MQILWCVNILILNIISLCNLYLILFIKILILFGEFYTYIQNKIMRTLFKVLRWFFYFFTVVTGIVYMRGEVLFEWNFGLIKSIVIPWYLVFCGLMLWYLIATFRVGREKYKEEINKERIATRSFIIWIVFWILFALIYILAY